MQIHFRRVKDLLAPPLHAGLRVTQPFPPVQWMMFAGLGSAFRLWYHFPGSHLNTTTRNFCRLIGRDDPNKVFAEFTRKVRRAAGLYGELMRHGAARLADKAEFDAESMARCERVKAEHGCGIFVVPHCAGSVLSVVGFARRFPSVALVRESRSEARSRLMTGYFEKMGAETLFVRRADPSSVARGILKALHQDKFVIGTTDLLRRTKDTVPVTLFGQDAHLPAWPARFSARRNVPIIPGYVRLEGDRILLSAGTPCLEKDIGVATQRWADYFLESFRAYPSDWLFLYEKRWSRLIAQAVAARAQ